MITLFDANDNGSIWNLWGIAQTVAIGFLMFLVLNCCFGGRRQESRGGKQANEAPPQDEEPDPPRNFTLAQLRAFDGSDPDKPVLLSLKGIVFDCTAAKSFYGPEGPYAKFAGRECGVALAKMSLDEDLLDDFDFDKLNFGQLDELNNWITKFQHYRQYPIRGRCVPPALLTPKTFLLEEIRQYRGEMTSAAGAAADAASTTESKEKEKDADTATPANSDNKDVPEGYATAPIYVAVRDKVYDMSFGGSEFYGPDGPYHKFAGRDITKCLARMKLDPDDPQVQAEPLTEQQEKTLQDWIVTFETRKLYPCMGTIVAKK